MLGREAAARELGGKCVRWIFWTIIIYITSIFYYTWDFEGIGVFGCFIAMLLSALSTFGALSLARDIAKGRLKESMKEIWKMLKG